MIELIVVGAMSVIAIGVVVFSGAEERRQSRSERTELLNRIMSRDYSEYASQENKTLDARGMQVISVVDLEKALLERDEERLERVGMPV